MSSNLNLLWSEKNATSSLLFVLTVSYGSPLSDGALSLQPSLVFKYSFHLRPIDPCCPALMMSHTIKCDDLRPYSITLLSCTGRPL